MKVVLKHIIAAVIVVFALAGNSLAQEYFFSVPKMQMQVTVEPDASVTIVYDITFRNSPRGHRIDVVDIGTPHLKYDLSKVTASMGGVGLSDIRPSQYVDGFEVHLHAMGIPPRQTGTLHVEFPMPDMVFQDTTRKDLASLRITPTWFGRRYVAAPGDIELAIHLPESVTPDEALHQGIPFTQKALTDAGTSVVWLWQNVYPSEARIVGVSFPKADLHRVVEIGMFGLLVKWFEESPELRKLSGFFLLGLFVFTFLRFTGRTGIVVCIVLVFLTFLLIRHSPAWHLVLIPVVVGLTIVNEGYLRRRRTRYMPPVAQLEGGGIKRGLTAPEAAALLELPLGKVLGLVIFGMLRKGIVQQVTAEPLTVNVSESFRIDDPEVRSNKKARAKLFRKAGQDKGIVVHKYEHPFIVRVQENAGKPVSEVDFTVALMDMIERVARRLRGFDLSDTQDYYKRIVRRAVETSEGIGDVSKREDWIDRYFTWILMDDDYSGVFTYGRGYRPTWVRTPTVFGSGGGTAPAGGTPGRTSFGDVAASFAGWTENTMGSLASSISPSALSTETLTGGFVDLSGADRLTVDFFQAISEASSSGGGGGGGCACAGCACACACAGGGR